MLGSAWYQVLQISRDSADTGRGCEYETAGLLLRQPAHGVPQPRFFEKVWEDITLGSASGVRLFDLIG